MSIFGLFLIPLIILFIIIIGVIVTVVRGILRLFGFSNGQTFGSFTHSSRERSQSEQQTSTHRHANRMDENSSSSKKKVIGDDEGEYVDFEEIR